MTDIKETATTTAAALKPRTFDMKFEIVVIPVSDVDRAKRFYSDLGWRLDADFAAQKAQTTGDFSNEVDKVTNPAVRPLATKEHVVVQAVSVASATVDDPGPDVQVIIFLNQAVTLDLLPAPRLDRNRVLASMRLVDGQWKVAGIKAL